jgi:acetate kinase
MAENQPPRQPLTGPEPASGDRQGTLLVVNCGSSTLKLALFDLRLHKIASVLAEKLEQFQATAHIQGDPAPVPLPSHASHRQALEAVIQALFERGWLTQAPVAIGHRVVHGGERFRQAVRIDDRTREAIADCASLAPLHNPVNLAGIDSTRSLFPGVPQIAVFDTAFHQTLPPRAFLYALPQRFYRQWGVRRYGFHGTSHAFMLTETARLLGQLPEQTSLISAHLGNGCSIAAIDHGHSVDTSMGLTPLEGLVMGSRSGDVDPGLFDFLKTKGIGQDELHRILNEQSGLLGLSGQSNDMRTLCELADQGHEASATAIDVFCFRLARYIGAMMASLRRLDALVFTGGIGENSARIRRQTLASLGLLGFAVDPERNSAHGRQSNGHIESGASRFPVLVIATDEERVIAGESLRLATPHT